jgi:hypothetical protein
VCFVTVHYHGNRYATHCMYSPKRFEVLMRQRRNRKKYGIMWPCFLKMDECLILNAPKYPRRIGGDDFVFHTSVTVFRLLLLRLKNPRRIEWKVNFVELLPAEPGSATTVSIFASTVLGSIFSTSSISSSNPILSYVSSLLNSPILVIRSPSPLLQTNLVSKKTAIFHSEGLLVSCRR